MDARSYIAVTSILLSVAATALTLLHATKLERLGRTPVVVIRFDEMASRWVASNVGNGPALNIVVAQQSDEDDEWYNPVLLPIVASGESYVLAWLGSQGDFSLGARYESVLADSRTIKFFTHTRHDRCAVYRLPQRAPNLMPEYPIIDVRRHWEADLPDARPQT